MIYKFKVRNGDGLPKILCVKCVGRLKIAYEFRKQAEATDKHLRGLISQFTAQLNQSIVHGFKEEESDHDDIEELLEKELESEIIKESSDQIQPIEHENVSTNDTVCEVILSDNVEDNIVEEDDGIIYEDQDNTGIEDTQDQENIDIEDAQNNGVPLMNEGYEISEIANSSELTEITEYETELPDELDEEIITGTGSDLGDGDDETEAQYYIIEDDQQNYEDDTNFGDKSNENNDSSNSKSEYSFPKVHHCSKCNKNFSTKTNLMRHMRTHDGNSKPYECHICNHRFTQNGSLKQHMFLHSGERPYQCEFCNRSFTQAKSLKFHVRRHTGSYNIFILFEQI